MEDAVSTFGFKVAVLVVTYIDGVHKPIEIKDIVLSYPSITQVILDSHCEILWYDNSLSYLGHYPTANYASGLDYASKQAIIDQQRLISKILDPCIKKSLTTDFKLRLRDFVYVYTLNTQYYRAKTFFVIVKMV